MSYYNPSSFLIRVILTSPISGIKSKNLHTYTTGCNNFYPIPTSDRPFSLSFKLCYSTCNINIYIEDSHFWYIPKLYIQ